MSANSEYWLVITEMKRGRPDEGGAPFSILGSKSCDCNTASMSVQQRKGFDFVENQALLACGVIEREGEAIMAKKCHWGGEDHSKYHAFCVGPFKPSVHPAVVQHIRQSAFQAHFQLLDYDKN